MCFCSHQGITKLLFYYIFYVSLMTNQNTKNMCLFFLFTNFFRKRFGSKTSKNDSFKPSQSSVNSSQTWVNREFSKIFGWSSLKRLLGSCVYFHAFFDKSKIEPESKKYQKQKFFKNWLEKPVSHILETGFQGVFCQKLAIFSILCFVPHSKIFQYFQLINSTIHLLLISCEPLDYNFPS